MQELVVARLSAGSIFKIVGIGLLCSLLPFTVAMGCTAYFGFNTLSWNNEPATGTAAIFAAPFIGLFLVAIFTMFMGCAITLGLWLYSFVSPIELSYKAPARVESSGA